MTMLMEYVEVALGNTFNDYVESFNGNDPVTTDEAEAVIQEVASEMSDTMECDLEYMVQWWMEQNRNWVTEKLIEGRANCDWLDDEKKE
tara:strand:- start:336 stop:602 length:267 start_codon:yes stop_codon:yes gene_type:complete